MSSFRREPPSAQRSSVLPTQNSHSGSRLPFSIHPTRISVLPPWPTSIVHPTASVGAFFPSFPSRATLAVLLAAVGREPSEAAAVRDDGRKDCRLAGGDGVDGGGGCCDIRRPSGGGDCLQKEPEGVTWQAHVPIGLVRVSSLRPTAVAVYAGQPKQELGRFTFMSRFILIVFTTLLPSLTNAKRAAPAKAEPVVHRGVRYIASNDDGRRAYIEAWDVQTNLNSTRTSA